MSGLTSFLCSVTLRYVQTLEVLYEQVPWPKLATSYYTHTKKLSYKVSGEEALALIDPSSYDVHVKSYLKDRAFSERGTWAAISGVAEDTALCEPTGIVLCSLSSRRYRKAPLAVGLVSSSHNLGNVITLLEGHSNCQASQFIVFLTWVTPQSWTHFWSLFIRINGCAIFLASLFFFYIWKVVITKTTVATGLFDVNYFKWAKETKHLRRKWLRNWKESIMPCSSWLVFGSFIFLLRTVSAIELRGRQHPVREIDGVWRRWGAPFSKLHLATL